MTTSRRALFIGGPFNGQVRECPASTILAPAVWDWKRWPLDMSEPAVVRYTVRKFQLGEEFYRVAVLDDVTVTQVAMEITMASDLRGCVLSPVSSWPE